MDNIYTTVRPFYLVLKFLGGFPISFEGLARKGIFKQKLSDVFISCIASLVFIFIFGMILSRNDTIYSPSEILMRAWIFSLIVCLMMSFIVFCYQISRRNSIVKFLKQIDAIDKTSKLLMMDIDYQQNRKFVVSSIWFILALTFFVSFGVSMFLIVNDLPGVVNPVLTPSYGFILLMIFVYILQFSLACIALKVRFKLLNDYLKCFSRSYKNLCNAVDLLNSTFTFHLVPIVINTLLIETFGAYSILVELRSLSGARGPVLLLNTTWFIVIIVLQVVIAIFGSSLSKEAQATAVIVSDILNELELREDVVTKLQNFLVRSQSRNLTIQNEFFVADWTLLVATTSTIVTYLIITMQFDSKY